MDKNDIKLIRVMFGLPESVTEADIEDVEIYLEECGTLGTPDMIRAANFMSLEEVRRVVLPQKPKPGMILGDDDILWLCRCERFFVDGLYGPCCLWARATLEYDLQEECLSSQRVSQKFKNRILDPKARNPSIDDYLQQLGITVSSPTFDACMLVKNNGNWVTHHRIDKLTGGDSLEITLRETGLSEEFIKSLMRSGERELKKDLRPNFERDRAIESMESLYLIKEEIAR